MARAGPAGARRSSSISSPRRSRATQIYPLGRPADPAEGDTANIVYILYLVSLVVGITGIVGVIMAYVNRADAPEWVQTHYRFQIRTFWIGLLYGLIGVVDHHHRHRHLLAGVRAGLVHRALRQGHAGAVARRCPTSGRRPGCGNRPSSFPRKVCTTALSNFRLARELRLEYRRSTFAGGDHEGQRHRVRRRHQYRRDQRA